MCVIGRCEPLTQWIIVVIVSAILVFDWRSLAIHVGGLLRNTRFDHVEKGSGWSF